MQRNTHFLRFFIIGFLLVFKAHVSAQTYSVQASLATTPPYYNYLSHYADQNNHLQVVLTLLDFNNPPINVRLRVRIEGPGYELYTNPNVVVGQSFQLESGVPLFLNDLDLQPYLQESNLIVSPSGLDLNNLPEGYTSICVDVILDGTNQEVLSTNNCTSFPLQRFQPSMPFLPACEGILDTNQLFHTFQWTDPIGYTPDANSTIEHTFSLYRWNDPNNFTIFQSDQGLVWRETVDFPMVQISDFDVAFENGGLYVWRVQSQIYSNGMPVQMIEDNGISVPCTFYFGEPQSLADILTDGLYIDLNTDPLSARKGKAYWTVIDNTPNEGLSTFDNYLVEYRRQPTGNESYEIPWFADTVNNFNLFIYQLEPSTTYEVKVSGIVGTNVGESTPVSTFTTPDPRVYACGEADLPFFPTNWTPLQNAQAGIQVQIGQFVMNTTQLEAVGSLGRYSGKGTIAIPFLMGAKAKVTFDDILIDTEYLVREGRVDVVTQGLENWLYDQYGQFVDPIYVNGVIDSAYVDSNGVAWAVVDGVSIPYTFDPPTYPIVLNDVNGNQYTIYPNGDIEISTYVAISEEWSVEPDEVAMFSQNENENRGFDPKEHMEWHANYEIMRLADSSLYFVANKSMAEGESDVVNVELPQGTQASFQLADGTPITSSSVQGSWLGQNIYPSGVKYTLNIPAMQNAGIYALHVFANNQKVGQLTIAVYSEKQKEVIVVPLVANLSVTEADIKQKLDETLGEANITVSVTLAPQWNDTTFTPTTTISLPTEVGLLNKYSDDMRDLRDAYFDANPTATRDAYYLFMVHSFDDPNEVGYMVRGRGMGFIRANQADVLNTIAHELGHGIGALEHTWKHNGPEEGATNNLMDYSGGTNLTIAQWRELRDSDLIPSMFDEIEDGSSIAVGLAFLEPLSNQNSFTFIDIHGKIFSIPKNAKSVHFSTLDRFVYQFSNEESNYLAPIGTVVHFELKGKLYTFIEDGYYEQNALGQALQIPSAKYIDTLTAIDHPSKAITNFLSPNNNKLNSVFFHTDTTTLVQSNANQSWIIFDDGSMPYSSSLVSFVNHFKSSGSSLIETVCSPTNFGSDASPITVYDKLADSLIIITPYSVFQATPAALNVDYLVKYLLLCNYKKNQFSYLANCIQEEMYVKLVPNDFHYIVKGCTTCVDLSRTNYVSHKDQMEIHFQESIESAIATMEQASYPDFNTIVNNGTLAEIKSWIYSKSSCVMFGMPANLRIRAFNRLITNDNYWNVALLLITEIDEANTQDVSLIVNTLIDGVNSDWLSILMPQLHEWEGDSEDFVMLRQLFDRFIELCGGQESNPRFAKTIFTKTIPDEINPLLNEPATLTYNSFQQPIFLAKNSSTKYYGGIGGSSSNQIAVRFNNSTPYEIYYENGKVHVIQNYNIWSATVGVSDPNWTAPETTFSFHHELNPYENVTVQFLDNYATELGFDADENVVVPAYYLLLMSETIDHSDWHSNFRMIMDGLEIVGGTLAFISAPLTAGGSLALVGAIVAATDIEVEQNRNNSTNAELDAFETWDNFYISIQLITVAPTAYTLLGRLAQPGSFSRAIVSFRSLRTKLNQMPGNIKASLVYLRNVWNGTQTVADPASRLNTILAKSGFSGTGGIYEQLLTLSPSTRRTADYTSLESFRDRFIFLHNANTNGVKNIDDVLDDLDNLVSNHYNVPDVHKYVDELMQSSNKFKGGAFGLEILNDLPPALQGKTLIRFEASIDDLADATSGCRFDLQFSNGSQLVYIETKNYAQSTAFTSSFYNQFNSYISNPGVSSIDQIKYYFRANSGVSKAERVQKFKNMLLNGNKYEEVFDGMSQSLKASLNVGGLGGKQQFYNLIQSESETFFNFIEVF